MSSNQFLHLFLFSGSDLFDGYAQQPIDRVANVSRILLFVFNNRQRVATSFNATTKNVNRFAARAKWQLKTNPHEYMIKYASVSILSFIGIHM